MIPLTTFFFRFVALFLSAVYALGLPLAGYWSPVICGPALNGHVTVTAHAGCMRLAENSVEAMAAGYATGAEIVEFDLNFRADGTPVLSHYDPGDSDCATLEEAFAFLAKHPCLQANVDVKSTAFLEKVQPMAEAYGVLGQIFFTGLTEDTIPVAAKACPDIPYYLNIAPAPDDDFDALADRAISLGAIGVNLDHRNATPELVEAMHAKGLPVSMWTIDEAQDAVRAIRMGADNVTTRKPNLVRALSRSPLRDLWRALTPDSLLPEGC